MRHNAIHIAVAAVFLGALLLLSDPFMLFMPPMAAMAVILLCAILACVWSGFVMFEQASDEREFSHRMHAGRVAYLSGIGVLTLALLYQGFSHAIDPWVLLALGAMVFSKLAARFYSSKFH